MKISDQTLKTVLSVGAMALLLWGCAAQAPQHGTSAPASTVAVAQVRTPTAPTTQFRWFPKFVFFSPDGSHLLATLCKFSYGQRPAWGWCRPWRYYISQQRWEEVIPVPDNPLWSIDSASYSPDGKTIAAQVTRCEFVSGQVSPSCSYSDNRLMLIDAQSGKHRLLASAEPRFMPTFTPDGQSLVYWQLDSVSGVPTGTTSYPARQAQTLFLSHNLHMLNLSTGQTRSAIRVRSLEPLAPPRVFADGIRVTVAGAGIFGEVSYQGVVHRPIWGVSESLIPIDNSLIIGNLQTGEMKSLAARGFPLHALYDVREPAKLGASQLLSMYQIEQINISDMDGKNVINVVPPYEEGQGRDRNWGLSVSHASFAPKTEQFVFAFGLELSIADLRANTPIRVLPRPASESVENPVR